MTNEREQAQLSQRDALAAMVEPAERVLLWADQIGAPHNGATQYRNIRPAPEAYAALEFYADISNWTHHKDPRGGYGPRAANDDGARARQALGVEQAPSIADWRSE